MRLEQLGQT